jgi:hypothetical protein
MLTLVLPVEVEMVAVMEAVAAEAIVAVDAMAEVDYEAVNAIHQMAEAFQTNATAAPIANPPPPGVYQHFGGMVTSARAAYSVVNVSPPGTLIWIFDCACTSHVSPNFVASHSMQHIDETMLAANDTLVHIKHRGTTGTVSNVLIAHDFSKSLYSHKQLMREGGLATLSPNNQRYTITTNDISPRTLYFDFDGDFWIWHDDYSFTSSESTANIAVNRTSQPMTLRVTHSGAVHEFLLLHFRMGHINYGHFLYGLKAGYWKGFQHSLCYSLRRLSCMPHLQEYKDEAQVLFGYSALGSIAPWASLSHGHEDSPSPFNPTLLFFQHFCE